jgi:hypothetical protein
MKIVHEHEWKNLQKREAGRKVQACKCGARIVDHGLYGLYRSRRVTRSQPVKMPVFYLAGGIVKLAEHMMPSIKSAKFIGKMFAAFACAKFGVSPEATRQLAVDGISGFIAETHPELLEKAMQKRKRRLQRKSKRAEK